MAVCAESGDLSPLCPMSVKDLIWVHAAQRIRMKQKNELEHQKFEFNRKKDEYLYLAVCDLRDILMETHFFMKLHAVKDPRCKPYDVNMLPTNRKAEEERREKMTQEERDAEDLKTLLSGGIIRR